MTGSNNATAEDSDAHPRHVTDDSHPQTIVTDHGQNQHHASHLKRNRLHRWWSIGAKRLLLSRRRSPSLRAQVALSAAIGTFFIVTMIAIPLWTLIEDFNFNQADTRLQRLTTVVQGPVSRREFPDAGLDFTIRTPGISFSRGASPPDLPAGSLVTAQIDGHLYRVYTVIIGPTDQNKLAVAELLEPTLKRIDDQHRVIVVVGFAAVVAGGVLGWLLGGFAVRPLRELRSATRQVASSGGIGEPPHVTGAREVEAIAEAMRAMLARIGEERATSDSALATARDFALLSAHELRTPLTAMRTNLEVLTIHDLPQDDRQEIVGDVLRTQRRVEETLTALEHLAAHELNTDDDYADVNLNDLLDQAVVDAGRANPNVTIRLVASEHLHARAVRAGLRLAVDNAITNAIRHGHATRIQVTLTTTEQHQNDAEAPTIAITIDDNGCGVPEKQRDIVFRRFVRGTTAKGPGSGLGMALIAQQAQIHHGTAALTTSPQGGARLTITIPEQQPAPVDEGEEQCDSLRERVRSYAASLKPRRPRTPSLRARVAAAAAIGTALIAAAIGTSLWEPLERFNQEQTDQELAKTASIGVDTIHRNGFPDSNPNYIYTYRNQTYPAASSSDITLPDLKENTYATLTIAGHQFRVYTTQFASQPWNPPDRKLAVAAPLDSTLKHTADQHRLIMVVGFAAVVAGGVLGWLLGGFAVRPLRELASATRQVTSSGGTSAAGGVKIVAAQPQYFHVTGAREVEAIAEAMRAMLARIGEERATSDSALATARDFALLSAHELRTPLTAMRTNLEVLTIHDLPQDDRQEIVGDVLRTQRRVEETLTALEHLAAHELNTDDDYADVNLNDLLDQAVVDAGRANPNVTIRLVASEHLHARAVRAGLRLAVDNAITNAIRHGHATRIQVTLTTTEQHQNDAEAPTIAITIDDNGCGVPEKQRDIVFRRFVRGTTAKGPGSGLGMALIAQQAQIHHGTAALTTSPQGGARLTITIPEQQPRHTPLAKADTA